MLQESDFAGLEEQEAAAFGVGTPRGAAYPVDVVFGVVGWVVLQDPVDGGDVEPAGGDVGAEEGACRGVDELEEGGGAFLLLLFAVEGEVGEVDVVE